jgi:hypothetical protein
LRRFPRGPPLAGLSSFGGKPPPLSGGCRGRKKNQTSLRWGFGRSVKKKEKTVNVLQWVAVLSLFSLGYWFVVAFFR